MKTNIVLPVVNSYCVKNYSIKSETKSQPLSLKALNGLNALESYNRGLAFGKKHISHGDYPVLEKLIEEGLLSKKEIKALDWVLSDEDWTQELEQKLSNPDLRELFEQGAIEMADIAMNLPDDTERYIKYLKQGLNPKAIDLNNIASMNEIINGDKGDIAKRMFTNGATLKAIKQGLASFGERQLATFLDRLDDRYYRIEYTDLFDGDCLLTARKKSNLKGGAKKTDKVVMNKKGEIQRQRELELDDTTLRAKNENSNREVEIQYKKLGNGYVAKGIVSSQIEVVTDDSGKPDYVLYSKLSEALDGAFETTLYKASDYPDIDIIQAIKSGKIQGGKALSAITQNGATTTLTQNYSQNGVKSSRAYDRTLSESGETVSTKYSYKITSPNGQTLLKLDRSWQKLSSNSTLTTVNGKKYYADFDDDNMQITVSEGKNTHTISIKDKMQGCSMYNAPYGSLEEDTEPFSSFVKPFLQTN